MVQLKKKDVLLIGALMLLLGMGMNLQYALDDYSWADNWAVQVLATMTGDLDTSWPDPNKPVELGKVAKTESCILQTGSGITNSVKRTCNVQYVCPKCGCIPAACGEVFYN